MRHRSWAVAGVGVLMVLACGSGPVPSSAPYRGKTSPAPAAIPAAGVHTVPPDRALIAITVTAGGDGYAAAAGALRERIDALSSAGAEGGCEVSPLDYRPPAAGSWSGMVARAELLADVPLVGLATVPERMDALDACLRALGGVGGIPEDELALGSAALQVDAPEASFGVLAQRFADEQARAASVAGAQSHPEDRRCVPSGKVLTGQARLSGVELTLDVACRIDAAASPGT